jgi:hypothetical protein
MSDGSRKLSDGIRAAIEAMKAEVVMRNSDDNPERYRIEKERQERQAQLKAALIEGDQEALAAYRAEGAAIKPSASFLASIQQMKQEKAA